MNEIAITAILVLAGLLLAAVWVIWWEYRKKRRRLKYVAVR